MSRFFVQTLLLASLTASLAAQAEFVPPALNHSQPLWTVRPAESGSFFAPDGSWWVGAQEGLQVSFARSSDAGANWAAKDPDWQGSAPDAVTGFQILRGFGGDSLFLVSGVRNGSFFFWFVKPGLDGNLEIVKNIALARNLSMWKALSLDTGRIQIWGVDDNQLFWWMGSSGNSTEHSSWSELDAAASAVWFQDFVQGGVAQTFIALWHPKTGASTLEVRLYNEDALKDKRSFNWGQADDHVTPLAIFPIDLSADKAVVLAQGNKVRTWVWSGSATETVSDQTLDFAPTSGTWVSPVSAIRFEGDGRVAESETWPVQTTLVSADSTFANRELAASDTTRSASGWSRWSWVSDDRQTVASRWDLTSTGWTKTASWNLDSAPKALTVVNSTQGTVAIAETLPAMTPVIKTQTLASNEQTGSVQNADSHWGDLRLAFDPGTLVLYRLHPAETQARPDLILVGGEE